MAQSDITIDALDKVGKEDAEYLVSLVRSVPGFPKEGIIFRDFMPVLADAKGLRILLNALEQALPVPPSGIRFHRRPRIPRIPVWPGHGRSSGQRIHRRA